MELLIIHTVDKLSEWKGQVYTCTWSKVAMLVNLYVIEGIAPFVQVYSYKVLQEINYEQYNHLLP